MSKNRVLIPIDESKFSLQILPYVQKFLDPQQTELVLLHVEEEPEAIHIHSPLSEDIDAYVDQQEAALKYKYAEEIEPEAQPLRDNGYEVRVDMAFGKPAQAIERWISYNPVDMIAMTTHGRRGLDRVILGSVAEHVLHHCHVPVMLLHPLSEIHKTNGSQN